MDLATLAKELSPDEQALLLNLVERGVRSMRGPRSAAERLLSRLQDVTRPEARINSYHARILWWLFQEPEGLELMSTHPSVLLLLEEQGRITSRDGRWHITRTAASLLYRSGHADVLIAETSQGAEREAEITARAADVEAYNLAMAERARADNEAPGGIYAT